MVVLAVAIALLGPILFIWPFLAIAGMYSCPFLILLDGFRVLTKSLIWLMFDDYIQHVEDRFAVHWNLWWRNHSVPWQLLMLLLLLASA